MGNRKDNLCKAIALISQHIGRVNNMSSLYESEAWGYESCNRFMNAAIEVETNLYPDEILQHIKQIESTLGREEKKNNDYQDRPIDIDILFYGNYAFETEILTVPHPLLEKRKFVLSPLAEIAPNLLHPTLKKTIKMLNEECLDAIKKIEN